MNLKEILEYQFLNIGDIHLTLFHLLSVLFIIVMARVVLRLISRGLGRYFRKREVDKGRQYALIQVIKYVIYTSALLMAIQTIGISISVLWGGAAALMVGIGLGLQQTFNDLVSGIILLIEGSIEVDDIIEVDGIVGTVMMIGIRTSKVETRDRISLVIPNSKLVGEKSINWSHNAEPTRFHIKVGVAYSSDVQLVTRILLQAAKDHKDALNDPAPQVQFQDFGNSSLDFILYFFSYNYLPIEFAKSELRYQITQLFRENKIEIPFPQNDLWIRNPEVLFSIPVTNGSTNH